MSFLSPPSIRKILSVPTQDKVDFRAACFCHKNIVDIGFVCSVCLSSMLVFFYFERPHSDKTVFCQPVPVCSTCRWVDLWLSSMFLERNFLSERNSLSKPFNAWIHCGRACLPIRHDQHAQLLCPGLFLIQDLMCQLQPMVQRRQIYCMVVWWRMDCHQSKQTRTHQYSYVVGQIVSITMLLLWYTPVVLDYHVLPYYLADEGSMPVGDERSASWCVKPKYTDRRFWTLQRSICNGHAWGCKRTPQTCFRWQSEYNPLPENSDWPATLSSSSSAISRRIPASGLSTPRFRQGPCIGNYFMPSI